jgi:hypothetical protein
MFANQENNVHLILSGFQIHLVHAILDFIKIKDIALNVSNGFSLIMHLILAKMHALLIVCMIIVKPHVYV